MPLPYDIDVQRRVVTITVPAPVRGEEVRHLLEAIVGDSRYEPGFAFLVDRTAVRAPPRAGATQAILSFVRRHPSAFAGARWAVVVSDDVPAASATLAIADALTALDIGLDVRTFLTLRDARRWLGFDAP